MAVVLQEALKRVVEESVQRLGEDMRALDKRLDLCAHVMRDMQVQYHCLLTV